MVGLSGHDFLAAHFDYLKRLVNGGVINDTSDYSYFRRRIVYDFLKK